MAKDRPGREAKKPKKEKPKAGGAATPLQVMRTPPTAAVPAGKKKE